MAITRIGSLTEYTGTGRDANTGSASITVPADAEIAVVCVHGYVNNSYYFTNGDVVPAWGMTLNSVALRGVPQGNASAGAAMGAVFYLLSPSTGTQTLAWDWLATDTPQSAARIVYAFYKGLHATTPIRDSDGAQNDGSANSTMVTPTLTAVAGDFLIGWSWAYTTTDGNTPTWSNASTVTDYSTRYPDIAGSWAEGAPSGDTTVTATWNASNVDDGGICALVLTPAVAGGGAVSLSPSVAAAALAGKGISLGFAIHLPDQA